MSTLAEFWSAGKDQQNTILRAMPTPKIRCRMKLCTCRRGDATECHMERHHGGPTSLCECKYRACDCSCHSDCGGE